MRKFILLILSGAMLAGGVWIVATELLVARGIYFRLAGVGVILTLFGGYLIWTDFIAPGLGIKTWED